MEAFKYTFLSILCGIFSNIITLYLQGTKYVNWDMFFLYVYVLVMAIVGFCAYRQEKRLEKEKVRKEEDVSLKKRLEFLHKCVVNPDIFKIVDVSGRELVGGHAGNFIWKEIAKAVCQGMALEHLRYSNLGNHYSLRNILTARDIEIPTDNRLEDSVIKTGVRNGEILLVVAKR